MFSPIFQNDDRNNENVRKAGCLFRSLSMLAEIKTRTTLTVEQIEQLYQAVIDAGYMEPDCYVLDHAAIIRETFSILGYNANPRYIGRHSRGGEHDFQIAGDPTAWISHGKTENGYGHFYVTRKDKTVVFDPWWPSPLIVRPLTFREYKV